MRAAPLAFSSFMILGIALAASSVGLGSAYDYYSGGAVLAAAIVDISCINLRS